MVKRRERASETAARRAPAAAARTVNPEKSFVKRVIAGEGDQVRITSGRVYVNGVALLDEFVPPSTEVTRTSGPRSCRKATTS